MTPLPREASDADLLDYVDRWAALLEAEDYDAAFAFTDHDPARKWTPQLMREAIKGYGDANPTQRVTVRGEPTDVHQRKNVKRWPPPRRNDAIGDVWYDLNVDG